MLNLGELMCDGVITSVASRDQKALESQSFHLKFEFLWGLCHLKSDNISLTNFEHVNNFLLFVCSGM